MSLTVFFCYYTMLCMIYVLDSRMIYVLDSLLARNVGELHIFIVAFLSVYCTTFNHRTHHILKVLARVRGYNKVDHLIITILAYFCYDS